MEKPAKRSTHVTKTRKEDVHRSATKMVLDSSARVKTGSKSQLRMKNSAKKCIHVTIQRREDVRRYATKMEKNSHVPVLLKVAMFMRLEKMENPAKSFIPVTEKTMVAVNNSVSKKVPKLSVPARKVIS